MAFSRLHVSQSFTIAAIACLAAATSARADILYVGNTGLATIDKYNSAGVRSVLNSTDVHDPEGVAFNSAGDLFVANDRTDAIVRISPAGVATGFATVYTPQGIAFDAAGNLFVASFFGNQIVEVAPDGTTSPFYTGDGGFQPRRIAFDAAGNLFATNGFFVEEITPAGVRSDFASGLSSCIGLAFNAAGDLFVTDSGSIFEYTPAGARSTFVSGDPSFPYDLAFDSSGNLFATTNGQTIEKFAPDGSASVFSSDSHLENPRPLAFTDNAGVPLPLANQSVPEPASLVLLCVGGIGLLSRRQRV